jgi:GxxExxY protein
MSAMLRAFQAKMATGAGLSNERIEAIATTVVDAAFRVHTKLGPGLLESVYQVCLAHELSKRGLRVEREVIVPVVYDEIEIQKAFEIDLLIEGCIIVELKAIENLLPKHNAQLLTHLKLAGCRLGFLINFNEALIKDGIRRKAL